MAIDPKSPLRANHRFLKKMLSVVLEGKVEHVPEEYDLISRIFKQAGGAWSRIFNGSPRDFELLKTVAVTAFKKGYLTKKHQWGA